MINEYLRGLKKSFESFLSNEIYPIFQKNFHPILSESCIYSMQAGGKRLRPVLCISAVLGRKESELNRNIFLASSALECIHTYSLIHDDLPAMDNDDFRRGLPTNHKKFGEAAAILAGDALNSAAFYLISLIESSENELTRDLIQILHSGAGGDGMISGQMEDIESENNPEKFQKETLHRIHEKKTGALILSSVLLGNRLNSDWREYRKGFKDYGEKLGVLFQITDDILDEESSLEEIGKTPGKDSAKGKLTYPAFYGMDQSKKLKNEIKEELEIISRELPDEQNFFKKLPAYIAERKN